MRIAMIGGGYVGLVSGACFAEFGTEVCVVETDAAKLAALQAGQIPIFEPGLDAIVRTNADAGRLSFGGDLAAAVRGAAAVFIAVGTPTRRGDGHADLTYVYEAARQIAAVAEDGVVIVTKSTVPVGTGREVARIVRETRPELRFSMASNPEFLREGSAIGDFLRPDRVIIGVEAPGQPQSAEAEQAMRALYRPLYLIETPIVFTGLETAELTKYAANAFLAMKVTFINEMADLCEKVGADVHDVARGMGLDQRIGRRFLHPGPGYGGSCFPKDTRALTAIARDAGAPVRLIETTVDINEQRKAAMAERIATLAGGDLRGVRIGVLGLTFKPDTDDMREASSIPILHALVEKGAAVQAYDPEGMTPARPLLPPEIAYCGNAIEAATGVDVLVVLTEWNQFRALSPERLRDVMRGRVVVDLRNIWDPRAMRAADFNYSSIGRP